MTMDVSSGGDGIGIPKDSAVVVMEDVPFVSEPHMHRVALAIIALGGTTAFALSLAAQFTRISTYSILTNPWGALYCSYPPSVATWLAVAAIFVLLFTEVSPSLPFPSLPFPSLPFSHVALRYTALACGNPCLKREEGSEGRAILT
ncbi:unnamed protein product [Closterium sp. NIES-53]